MPQTESVCKVFTWLCHTIHAGFPGTLLQYMVIQGLIVHFELYFCSQFYSMAICYCTFSQQVVWGEHIGVFFFFFLLYCTILSKLKLCVLRRKIPGEHHLSNTQTSLSGTSHATVKSLRSRFPHFDGYTGPKVGIRFLCWNAAFCVSKLNASHLNLEPFVLVSPQDIFPIALRLTQIIFSKLQSGSNVFWKVVTFCLDVCHAQEVYSVFTWWWTHEH